MPAGLAAQPEVQKSRDVFPFNASDKGRILVVENIYGHINVEGYDGNEIVIETTKTITSRTDKDRDRGKSEVKPGLINRGDAVLLYLDHPCKNFSPETITSDKIREGGWRDWKNDCHWDGDFDFRIDYNIKVPKDCDLRLSTVNDSDIKVSHIRGRQNICNVNGHITLDAVSGPSEVRTVNGDVNIHYARNPEETSNYYTLNGVINAYFKPGLSAECFFKTYNGSFYTDLEDVIPIQTKAEKNTEGKKFRYESPGGSAFKTGTGKTKLMFETFNGDVYLKTGER